MCGREVPKTWFTWNIAQGETSEPSLASARKPLTRSNELEAKNTRAGLVQQQAFQHPHALPLRRSVRRQWLCERGPHWGPAFLTGGGGECGYPWRRGGEGVGRSQRLPNGQPLNCKAVGHWVLLPPAAGPESWERRLPLPKIWASAGQDNLRNKPFLPPC